MRYSIYSGNECWSLRPKIEWDFLLKLITRYPVSSHHIDDGSSACWTVSMLWFHLHSTWETETKMSASVEDGIWVSIQTDNAFSVVSSFRYTTCGNSCNEEEPIIDYYVIFIGNGQSKDLNLQMFSRSLHLTIHGFQFFGVVNSTVMRFLFEHSQSYR